MKLVIIESPFAGDIERNVQYARWAVEDALRRGESPIASHLLYTQPDILDDFIAEDRALGIEAGLEWYRVAELCAVYDDHGISSGMQNGIDRAELFGVPVEMRYI